LKFYGKLKKYQKAIDAFKKAIEIKPGFHEAYRGIGFAYLKLKIKILKKNKADILKFSYQRGTL
jgi:tetratricopeptide (TPR) repeat protein